MANINDKLNKASLNGAKLNVNESIRAAGSRMDGIKKQDAESHSEAYVKGYPSYVDCGDNTGGCFNLKFKGGLTKDQVNRLVALGGKQSGDKIIFRTADKASVEKILGITNTSLNVDGSIRAIGDRLHGINAAEDHTEGWVKLGDPWVECIGGGDGGCYGLVGNLTKDQIGKLTSLGCKLSVDKISFSKANKAAVDKILNMK